MAIAFVSLKAKKVNMLLAIEEKSRYLGFNLFLHPRVTVSL